MVRNKTVTSTDVDDTETPSVEADSETTRPVSSSASEDALSGTLLDVIAVVDMPQAIEHPSGDEQVGFKGQKLAPKTASNGVAGWARSVMLGLLVLVIAASVFAYWIWTELNDVKSRLEVSNKRTAAWVEQITVDQQNIVGRVDQDIAQRLGSTTARIGQLEEVVQKLSQPPPVPELDNSLADVEVLLLAAEQRLIVERNGVDALKILQTAGDRIRAQSAAELAPLLEQLSVDISRLEELPTSDLIDVVGRLDSIIAAVDELPGKADELGPNMESPNEEQRPSGGGWRSVLSAMTDNLSQFVTISRIEGVAPPTVIPDQDVFVRRALKAILDGARVAVIRRDQGAFDLGIEHAGDWLTRYFDGGGQRVEALHAQLALLAGVELAPDIPDISGSLKLLRQIAGRRANSTANSTTAGSNPGGSGDNTL